MRIAWATDLHLNFSKEETNLWYSYVVSRKFDALFITGDIAEASSVLSFLQRMVNDFDIPVYFVLGNHDYYGGSIEDVRRQMEVFTETERNAFYLPTAGVCRLSDSVCVVGVDGWYDGEYGHVNPPRVIMNDWRLIKELKVNKDYHLLLKKQLEEISNAEAGLANVLLTTAANTYEVIYFLTHVPPWPEAAWHQDRYSDNDWAPWFTSKAVGDALEEVATRHPTTQINVLCGHTHSGGEAQILPNLRCRTGAAEYGRPAVTDVFSIRRC